jgi:DNA modification methylase
MRTTEGKPTLSTILLGDAERAQAMADALAAIEPIERYTHGFHTWPAGLHPDAARDLLRVFPGNSVLDPFCGGGTVLVEGRAAGRRVHGRDLSTVALRIAGARTRTDGEEILTRMRSAARKLTESAQRADQFPPEDIFRAVREWYAPHVLCELEHLRLGVQAADADIRPLLEVIFSSMIVKVSWRKSDTSAQRVKHDRPAGTTSILFHKKARELGRRIAELREATPAETPPAEIQLGDARRIRVRDPVDLVLTSPPYPGTYDYLPMQHLRRIWLGENSGHDADELGSRRAWRGGERTAVREWREGTFAWTKAAADALAPGGFLVVVIGDGLTPGGAIDTSEPTEEAGRRAGLRSIARASLERPDHARNSTRWEHVFAFQKPA